MRTTLLLLVAALLGVAANAFAVDPGKRNIVTDGGGRVNARIFTNAAVPTSATQAVSATCPGVAKWIQFYPGNTGDYNTKPNGTGAPNLVAVTDGTGWISNLAEMQPINQSISGTAIDYYGVQSDVVPNRVPYSCFVQ